MNLLCRVVWQLRSDPRSVWRIPLELCVRLLARRNCDHGMQVRFFDVGPLREVLAANIGDALDLIRDVDRHRFDRMRKDVSGLLIMAAPYSYYLPLTRTCVLKQDVVETGNASRIALSIIHESTHARLWRAGIPSVSNMRGRIERRCLKEEIRFLRLLGARGYGGTEQWISYLTQLAGTHYWETDALRQRQTDFRREALQTERQSSRQ